MKQKFKIEVEIYPQAVINQAIEDFSEVGDIKYKDKELVVKGENKEEIEEIFNEFMNYCIGLINS